jgi:hypothetical protein
MRPALLVHLPAAEPREGQAGGGALVMRKGHKEFVREFLDPPTMKGVPLPELRLDDDDVDDVDEDEDEDEDDDFDEDGEEDDEDEDDEEEPETWQVAVGT